MFKPQFAELVKAGTKRQTIRPIPKRMPNVGQLESWRKWLGLPYRSKTEEMAKVKLTGIERIAISETPTMFEVWLPDRPFNGALMKQEEWDKFAKDDGFTSMFTMVAWFKEQHELPFEGIVITATDV